MPYLLVFPKDLLQDYNMFKTLQREFSPLLGVLPTLLLCFTNLTGYLSCGITYPTLRYCF